MSKKDEKEKLLQIDAEEADAVRKARAKAAKARYYAKNKNTRWKTYRKNEHDAKLMRMSDEAITAELLTLKARMKRDKARKAELLAEQERRLEQEQEGD